MLKRSFNVAALMLLAACASQPPAEPPRASAEPVTDALPATAASSAVTSTAATTAAPVVSLAPALQQLMTEAAQLVMAGKQEAALAKYSAVQNAAPEHVSAWLNAALIKREQKQLPAALTLIETSLQHHTNDARALTLKGVVLREQGKVTEAKAAYLAAIQSDETYAPAHRNLAVLADLYLDDPALALRHMQRYAELVGDNKQVNGWVTELRRRVPAKAEGGQ